MNTEEVKRIYVSPTVEIVHNFQDSIHIFMDTVSAQGSVDDFEEGDDL